MGKTDSKNEKGWLGKAGGNDLKKQGGLNRKMRRTNWKNGKGWFESWEELTQKMGTSDSKHGRSESKQESAQSKHSQCRNKVTLTLHSHCTYYRCFVLFHCLLNMKYWKKSTRRVKFGLLGKNFRCLSNITWKEEREFHS